LTSSKGAICCFLSGSNGENTFCLSVSGWKVITGNCGVSGSIGGGGGRVVLKQKKVYF